jgi:hypothetical protein
VAQGEGPEFKPQYRKKKKKEIPNTKKLKEWLKWLSSSTNTFPRPKQKTDFSLQSKELFT